MIKKGSWIVVYATTSSAEKLYPAGKWVAKNYGAYAICELLEDAPHRGTLDVLNVNVYGREESIYDFQIVGKISQVKW